MVLSDISHYSDNTFILLKSLPSFSKGLGKSLDLFNTLDEYNSSNAEKEADYKAIKSDWEAVGNDIRKAIQMTGS